MVLVRQLVSYKCRHHCYTVSFIISTRYPGDSYAGGNPWQLLTAAHAEVFYLGAQAWADHVLEHGNVKTGAEHAEWRQLLYLGTGGAAKKPTFYEA